MTLGLLEYWDLGTVLVKKPAISDGHMACFQPAIGVNHPIRVRAATAAGKILFI